MARRRKSTTPALYELIRGGPAPSPEAEPPPLPREAPPPEPIDVPDEGWTWLRPGRSISVPVGYLLLAGAAVILVAVAAYTVGFKRADGILRARYEQQVLAQIGAGDAGRLVRDPMQAGEATGDGDAPPRLPGGGPIGTEPTGTRVLPTPEQEVGSSPRWGPLESEPRQPGYRYFVLMETDRGGATRLANYCRGEGLETYVVSRHNRPSRRLVIALPGFPQSMPTNSRQVRDLRQRINAIGDRWKRHKGGHTDLHDAYPLPYP
jgi:hypothetical protein